MILMLVLTAALVVIAATWRIFRNKLKDSKILRDTDLSVKGLVNALGIAVLAGYCISIGIMATQLMDSIAEQELATNAYGEAVYTEAIQSESEDEADILSEALPGATPEENEDHPSDNETSSADIPTQKPGSQTMSQESATTAIGATTEMEKAAESANAQEFADGTYSGTGYGFKSDITVNVSVQGGKITDVVVTDQRDDRKWFERAYSIVVQRVLSAQSANVDTVSGATYSSQGIIDGVAEALGKARAAAKQVVQ